MQQDDQPHANYPVKAWRYIRHFFSSIKLAIVLMLVLVGFGLIGTLLIQAPQGVVGDPLVYPQWVDSVARPVLGGWTNLIDALGLFNIFHSVWFLGAGFLLVLNIFVCCLNRWIRSSKANTSNKIVQSVAFYSAGSNSLELQNINRNLPDSAEIVIDTLRKRRYSTRTTMSDGLIYVIADKNRYMQFGTYFSHLSIILLIIGFVISGSTGFRNNNFMVAEGKTQDVGYNTGLSLRLNSFTDAYWEDGTPKDYASEITLYENGSPVKQGIIRVNHPIDYKGVRFYQSFFGPAVSLLVSDNNSKTVYKDVISLDSTVEGADIIRPAGMLNLQQVGLLVYVIAPGSREQDTFLGENQVGIEIYGNKSIGGPLASGILDLNNTKSLAGYQFTYLQPSKFSGFQVSKDPGVNIIWTASGLFLVSLCLVLYFPRRRAWALLTGQSENETDIRLRLESKRLADTAGEMDEVVRDIKARL